MSSILLFFLAPIILAAREQAVRTNLVAKASSVIDAVGDAVRTSFPPDQWLPFAAFAKDLRANAIQQFNLTDLLVEHNEPTIFYSTIDRPQAIGRIAQFAPASSKVAATPATSARSTATTRPTQSR